MSRKELKRIGILELVQAQETAERMNLNNTQHDGQPVGMEVKETQG